MRPPLVYDWRALFTVRGDRKNEVLLQKLLLTQNEEVTE